MTPAIRVTKQWIKSLAEMMIRQELGPALLLIPKNSKLCTGVVEFAKQLNITVFPEQRDSVILMNFMVDDKRPYNIRLDKNT
jgi:hypothetical protein